MLADADSGRMLWSVRVGAARALQWSADGRELLVLGRASARIYGAGGRLRFRLAAPPGTRLVSAALAPDGRTLAIVRAGIEPGVAVATLDRARPTLQTVRAGTGIRQVLWAPDSRWLLASWPAADQWVFVRVGEGPRIAAASGIEQQFAGASAGAGARAFPRLEGWCCTAAASSG